MGSYGSSSRHILRGEPTENICKESGFKVFGNLSFEVLRPTRKVAVKLTWGRWIELARY